MKNVCSFLLALAMFWLFSGCASLSGLQTAKTNGKDNAEIFFSANFNQTPDFDIDEDDDGEVFFFPNIELGGSYGVHEKVDIGIRMSTNLNILAEVKYQVVGDQESDFAAAVGAGVGAFGFISSVGGLYNFQIPMYTSYHPSDNFGIYLAPRYIGQFGTGDVGDGDSNYLSYIGANTGFLWGKKTKFGVDIGYFGVSGAGDANTTLLQIGLGMKFMINRKD
jgi:hypothetical protein